MEIQNIRTRDTSLVYIKVFYSILAGGIKELSSKYSSLKTRSPNHSKSPNIFKHRLLSVIEAKIERFKPDELLHLKSYH